MSFHNGTSVGLVSFLALNFGKQDCQVERANSTGQIFSRAISNLMNVILEGKVTFVTPPYNFGAKLIALKKLNGGLRPLPVGNLFRRLSAKFAVYHVFESRQARYGSRQVRVDSKTGAGLASHVFRGLNESSQPNENVISKPDIESFFTSTNRQFMLSKTFKTHPEVYNDSHSA